MKKTNQKGFTLIELLVVIAIIGLLSTLAVVSLNSARGKARNARRMSDLKQISTAMELMQSDEDVYPTNIGASIAAPTGLGAACGEAFVIAEADVDAAREVMCFGSGIGITDGTDVFLANIPTDPSTDEYYYEGTGDTYCISALLEDNTTYFVCSNGSCFENGANNCTELGINN